MKALSVKQPWASLICCGLKDVENRKWALKTLPLRMLIHAGATSMPINEENQYEILPAPWVWDIENYKLMGILPDLYKNFPKSAVIGVATIEACEEGNESLWAQRGPGAEFQWVMKDVKMFKEPVRGVKGALGIFDIQSIDENNLPEFAEIPHVERNGKTVRIPLCHESFDGLKNGEIDNLELFLTNNNVDLFADPETLDPLPTETVTFFSGKEEITKTLRNYTTGLTADENGDSPDYDDDLGRLYNEALVILEF